MGVVAAAGGCEAPDAPADAGAGAPMDAGGPNGSPKEAALGFGVKTGVELLVHPVSTSDADTAITAEIPEVDNLDTVTE
jgi:hypothetical protein